VRLAGGNGLFTCQEQGRKIFGFGNNGNNGGKKNEDEEEEKEVIPARSNENTLPSLGFGDAAPKPDVVLGLGVSRVRFPGMVHSLHLSPEATRAITAERQAGRPYLGLFLRKENKSSSEGQSSEEENDGLRKNSFEEEGDKSEAFSQSIRTLPLEILSEFQKDIDPNDIIHTVGTFAQVHTMQEMPDGGSQALVLVHRRLTFDGIKSTKRLPPLLKVKHWQKEEINQNESSNEIRAISNEIVATIRELVQMNPLYREHMQFFAQRIDISDPYKLADFACSLATGDSPQLQQALEAKNVLHRLNIALELVSKERELSRIQQQISQQVEAKISSQQRNFLLHEQLKAIKKELGLETDDKEALIQKFQHKLNVLDYPEKYKEELLEDEQNKESLGLVPIVAKKAIEEELQKLQMLEKNSAEFNVTRSYLEWLTSIPWGKLKKEQFEIKQAQQILDAEHYGMAEVKDRILELIAIGKLKGSIKGKILCFIGPPGVGKTSIASSIAQALNRDFVRFSVGGLSDVAEIKGHRRTYIGAMAGKPIQALKSSKSMNPLILLDEIDKIGSSASGRGDPASALLELLDPSQNAHFLDHYLDIPVDFSNCLFICTANVDHTIPTPLLDRMEIIRLAGYDLEEKLHIAHNYLVPRALEATGLQEKEESTNNQNLPSITDDALRALIKGHAREAGVRSLQKLIEKICRKLAFKKVQQTEITENPKQLLVDTTNLNDFVGQPKFAKDRLYDVQILPPGVVCGLAWTSMGGSTLYIETTKFNLIPPSSSSSDKQATEKNFQSPRLSTTGQLGSVMEESSRVALAHVRAKLDSIGLQSTLNGHEIHIHVPEGATPKDGPSAGITLATALISLATGIPVPSNLAMTGELSLTGRVLPVGGIKEKVIAARRAHISYICLPYENERDFNELPDYLKQGITPYFAQTFDDVLSVTFFQSGEEANNESGVSSSSSSSKNALTYDPNILNKLKQAISPSSSHLPSSSPQ